MKYSRWILLCISILLLAIFLRVYNLTLLPIFADEAIYIRWAQVMRSVPELRFLPLSDGKQPLFMWIVIPFFKLFSDPLFAGRIVSVLCGIGTTIGVGVLTWILFVNSKQIQNKNDKISKFWNLGFGSWNLAVPFFAMLFYAISPFAVFFDRMALADSMLSMFGIWTFIFAILAVRGRRLDMAMIAGFMLGGAALTKSPALYFQLLLPTTLLFADWTGKKKEKIRTFVISLCLIIVPIVLSFGFYNILRLGANFHMLQSRSLDYVYPLSHIFERPFDPLKPFLMEVVRWFWIMGPSILIILIIAGIFINIKRYPKQILFLSILAIVPVLVSAEYAKVFTARYIFFSIPYFMILASTIMYSNIPKLCKQIGIGIFVIHSLFIDFQLLTNPQNAPLPRSERSGYLEEWTAGYGLKEVDNFIRGELKREPDKKIVIGTEGYFGTLPDGLQMYLNDHPEVTIIGVGQPIRDVHNSLLESKQAGNKTYLVVNDSRFLGNAEKLNLQLIESYPKAEKPDGTRESLLFFEVMDY